jgi:drug/metabolite transporter (DMT)-like permease
MPLTESRERRGYLLAAAAAALWGMSGVISKHLFNAQMRPIELISVRTLIAALILVTYLAVSRPHLLRIKRSDIGYFALLGFIGLAANQYAYYVALDLTSVAFALLLQYLSPLFLLGYGVIAKTETMTAGKLFAAFTAIAGCVLIVAGQSGGIGRTSLPGVLFAITSAACFAFYTRYGQIGLGRYDASTVLTYAFVFSALAWLIMRPVWTLPLASYSGTTWLFVVYLASFATVLPFAFYLSSLKHLEASRTNITSMLEPVVAAFLAWIWLGERMTSWQVIGGVAVLGGVLMLQLETSVLRQRRKRILKHTEQHGE